MLYISIAVPIGIDIIVLFAALLTLAACFMWKKSKQGSFYLANNKDVLTLAFLVEDMYILHVKLKK